MARTELVVYALSRDGVVGVAVAGTVDGHQFSNDGKTWIEVLNTDATAGHSRDLTIVTQAQVDGEAVADRVVTIPDGTAQPLATLIGPFTPSVYNAQSGSGFGEVQLNFPAGHESDLTVTVYRLP